MQQLLWPFILLASGCLGEATFNSNDLSASVFDLSKVDQGGSGDGGSLYNCVQLNSCEQACASDPVIQMCITNCRAKASTAAVAKELALQSCFSQQCPQRTDAGTSAICTQTDMGFTAACTSCIANSQVAPANMCSGANPPECHQCYGEHAACVADQ